MNAWARITVVVLLAVAWPRAIGAERKKEPIAAPSGKQGDDETRFLRNDSQWRKLLTPMQFHVTRKKGTEAPFTGEYWNTKTKGTYCCVCCGGSLFHSDCKFDSGTGWPSFHRPFDERVVEYRTDHSMNARRTEVICRRCDAHLGHVFTDGPAPTGLRYCINSAALRLTPSQKADPPASAKR